MLGQAARAVERTKEAAAGEARDRELGSEQPRRKGIHGTLVPLKSGGPSLLEIRGETEYLVQTN